MGEVQSAGQKSSGIVQNADRTDFTFPVSVNRDPDNPTSSRSGTLPSVIASIREYPFLANLANLLTITGAAVLLLPTVATLWFRWAALRADKAKQRVIWAGFRSFWRFILAAIVAVWWVL